MEDEKVEVEVVTLEDNKDYIILARHENYLLLVNENDEEDICVRKEEGDFLIGLESEEEVDKALKIFHDILKKVKE